MVKISRLFPFLILILILAACGNEEPVEFSMSNKVPEFNATTQDDEEFTTDEYLGKWSVVDFIFTNCATVCIPMSHNMSRLQDDVAEAGLEDVQFITYSIDPDFDTPEVLREYATNYNADLSNWTFLTGYEFDEVKSLSIKTFKLLVAEPEPGSDQVIHQTRFALVNPEGKVANTYGGVEDADIDEILEDLKLLAK